MVIWLHSLHKFHGESMASPRCSSINLRCLGLKTFKSFDFSSLFWRRRDSMENEKNGRTSMEREMIVGNRPAAIAGASFEALQVVNRTGSPLPMNSHGENLSQSNGFEKEGLPARNDGDLDSGLDPRKMKKIISNRASAQKSRLKKLQHVADMERKLEALQAHIAVLSPQVTMYQNQKQKLQMEKKSLTQQISAIAATKKLKDAQIEENKAELNRLRQVHLKQCYQYLQTQALKLRPETSLPEQIRGPFGLPETNGNHSTLTISSPMNNDGGSPPETQGRRAVNYKWMPTPGLRRPPDSDAKLN